VGVASGTDALRLALQALGVGPGDEVITPAFSFVASSSTIALTGATPVFVDIEPDTYSLDVNSLERALTPRTRGIVVVHLYGHPAAMEAVSAVARARGLFVIEDAAQAVGAVVDGRPVGAWGDVTCLSFYPTKNLGACGDGGMILTDRDDLAQRARRLRHHGDGGHYQHVELGFCSRLDELQAAILSVKLRHLEEWTLARRRIAERYRVLLAGTPLTLPVERVGARGDTHPVAHPAPGSERLLDRLALAAEDEPRGVEHARHGGQERGPKRRVLSREVDEWDHGAPEPPKRCPRPNGPPTPSR